MSLTDEVAIARIRDINDAIEKAIDKKINDNAYARPILLLDAVYEKSPLVQDETLVHNELVEYKNYFFGKEAKSITDPYQCTIAR